MIRTFLAELKYIFTHKWRIFEFILILLVPFMFGFVPTAAMKNPTGQVNNLKVAVINRDQGVDTDVAGNPITSINYGDALFSELSSQSGRFVNVDDIYTDPNLQLVDSGMYSSVIIIPEYYSSVIRGVKNTLNEPGTWFGSYNAATQQWDLPNYRNLSEILYGVTPTGNGNFGQTTTPIPGIIDYFVAEIISANPGITEADAKLIIEYHSYKDGFITGMMGDVRNVIASQIIKDVLPDQNNNLSQYFTREVSKSIENVVVGSLDKLNANYIPMGTKEWGQQMFPQYIMMGLFIGAMSIMFLIRNTRHITNASTSRHYFGKTLAFIAISILQTSLLLAFLPAAGVNFQGNGAGAVFYIYGIALMFALFAQAMSFMFKKREFAYFVFVLLMVLSMVSTMIMADMNPGNVGFRIMTFLSPSTYGASGLAAVIDGSSSMLPLFGFLALIAITGIAMIISLEELHIFDKRTKSHKFGEDHYESFNENHELAK